MDTADRDDLDDVLGVERAAWIDPRGFILDRSPRWSVEGHAFEMPVQINFTGNASVPLFRRHCLEQAGRSTEAK